jgi:hypothetical protein
MHVLQEILVLSPQEISGLQESAAIATVPLPDG